MSVDLHPKRFILLYAFSCVGIPILSIGGIFLLINLANAALLGNNAWVPVLVAVLVVALASLSNPLAFLANAIYHLLIDRGEFVLWGLGYALTLLPHALFIVVFFGTGWFLVQSPIPWILFVMSATSLLFPLIYWPIAGIRRKQGKAY